MRRLLAALALAVTAQESNVWTAGPQLFGPGPAGAADSVAVKDPSIVHYKHRWHLFYTARNATDYTLGHVSAPTLAGLATAPRHPLSQFRASRSRYAAAPQAFYFRPHQKWYLIFQTNDANYQPVYSTSTNIDDPASWTPAVPLVVKADRAKWIDFWVICDEQTAYLFFTRDHRDVSVMSTRLADFPAGFTGMHSAFAPVHEAVHVYAAGNGYVMLYEKQNGDVRRFGLARAKSLAGPWTTADADFAKGDQLRFAAGQERWTDEISHGELLRSGWDERLQIPAGKWIFLIQGLRREEHRGDYSLLPWRLGLISSPWAKLSTR